MPDLDLLACLGWDDAWSSALTAHLATSDRRPAAQLAPARVSRADRDSCDVPAPGPDGRPTLTAGWGGDVLVTSATTGVGLEPLRAWLGAGATVALLGASGVGKSTLLNALIGAPDAVMRTQALRADGK